ncbi:ATP-dependent zinc protease [Pseudoalteromonas sp. MMG010]|uniref:ATP-dependent zinc protease family protein n=1 Tax=Pseudoalteromonas sp. MMG010 TaxID=2822685 RepID=UPI001B3A1CCA|nr:ATP-dependent zinc protease [Pseudoalteromonas sp. MMG010]MBQ4832827.1 ATP-dependent zinc protease [Pseudoalteromonas sp. MMG010]
MIEKITVGWREWVSLPALGIGNIKAKIDSGARTSCLHALHIEEFEENAEQWVKFITQPVQGDVQTQQICKAKVKRKAYVKSSSGQEEYRYFIATQLHIGNDSWPIELTLSSRANMKFRMLLGRTAMQNRMVIDPALSYVIDN